MYILFVPLLVKETSLSFDNNLFDGLTAFYSIIHVPKEMHSKVYDELYRVLKPEGYMLVIIGYDEEEHTSDDWYNEKMFWSHYDYKKSVQLIKDAGFKIIKQKPLIKKGDKQYLVIAQKPRNNIG